MGKRRESLKIFFEDDWIWCINMHENVQTPEKAILIGIETGDGNGESLLDELGELVNSAGAQVSQKFLQKRSTPDSAHYIGKGKLEEISQFAEANDVNLLVFDDELSGAQIRNIENSTSLKVVDRTTIILDIFAKRARSKEGRLQVELAQQKYRLPRLMGVGTELSRLGGGIGTRGPGETKLETDRRHIRKRVSFLERELKELGKRRSFQRQSRKKNEVPVIALVGYTNTGKSTILNTLCNSQVIAENMLFATLDPTARKLLLPSGRESVLIDTVGFIRKLPHDLVDAFKSTLEEVVEADLLLHVADINNPEVEEQIKVVNDILQELGAQRENMLLVLNKIDSFNSNNNISNNHHSDKDDNLQIELSNDENTNFDMTKVLPPIVSGITSKKIFATSALTGNGLKELLFGIEDNLPIGRKRIELFVPYSEGWVLPFLYEKGEVLKSECLHEGINAIAMVDIASISKLEEYII